MSAQSTDSGKAEAFKCPECDFAATTSNSLLMHWNDHRKTARPHRCPECPVTTSTEHLLKIHVSSNHKNQRTFQCMSCGFAATNRGGLKRHERAAHALDSVPCSEAGCEFRSAFTSEHEKHVDNVHKKEKQEGKKEDPDGENVDHRRNKRTFPCSTCEFESSTKSGLKRHETRAHGDGSSLKKAKKKNGETFRNNWKMKS